MQKPRRELALKRIWCSVRKPIVNSNVGNSSQCEEGLYHHQNLLNHHRHGVPATLTSTPTTAVVSMVTSQTTEELPPFRPSTNCALPLLQVWPSSDSPRGEADGQSFVFPVCGVEEDTLSQNSTCFCEGGNANGDSGNLLLHQLQQQHDSGIESTQVSPSPALCSSAAPSPRQSPMRRPSSSGALLLHPDHARLLRLYPASSPEHSSVEDVSDGGQGGAQPGSGGGSCRSGLGGLSASSSTTSSLTSVAAAVSSASANMSRHSDSADSRRRSSTMTARYSLFDALDLEYALLRAAARGSVGPYSLSESLHKLTFTQSLAFPALARGLASKRRRSQQLDHAQPLNPSESGLNAFAKVVTALVLMLVSILVFAVVYKFVRT